VVNKQLENKHSNRSRNEVDVNPRPPYPRFVPGDPILQWRGAEQQSAGLVVIEPSKKCDSYQMCLFPVAKSGSKGGGGKKPWDRSGKRGGRNNLRGANGEFKGEQGD
jgi:hypothetical protein